MLFYLFSQSQMSTQDCLGVPIMPECLPILTFLSLQKITKMATFSPRGKCIRNYWTEYVGCSAISRLWFNCLCHVYFFRKLKMVDGVEIPVHIIGYAAYPLKPWLMKGFAQLSQEQACYTLTLSSARMAVENAFGLLKRTLEMPDEEEWHWPSFYAKCCSCMLYSE